MIQGWTIREILFCFQYPGLGWLDIVSDCFYWRI